MTFVEQVKIYPLRTLKTALCCSAYIGVGGFIAIFGPCLLDLQSLTQVPIDKIALILPARSGGYAIGSIIVGFIGEFLDPQVIIIFSLLITCITSASFGFIYSINLMYIIIFIGGMASGSVDTIGNVWIIHIWGKENPPFMQLLHFFFGCGALVAPFIAEPFLLKNQEQFEGELNYSISRPDNQTVINEDVINELKIHWPFIIAAIYNFIVFLAFIIVYLKNPSNDPHPSRDLSNSGNQENKNKWSLNKPVENKVKMLVISLAVLFMHAYVGLEISFGSLLATFAVKSNLKLSKSEGSYLSGMYWAAYTFFRIFTIFIVDILAPIHLLTLSLSVIMISNGILLPLANNFKWALWVGSIIMGLGCSPVFATMFAFLENFTPVTSRITAGFMVSACVGEFIIPYVVGAYIETNPEVYLYVVLIYSLLSVFIFTSLTYILSVLHKKQKNDLKVKIPCIDKF